MTVKTIQDLGKRMEAQMIDTIWETLKKDIEELRYKEWWTTQYLKLKKKCTRRNQEQSNWGRRMDKWTDNRMVEITAIEQNEWR